ncbi:Cysteine synthase [hydrothermal vent metagenome]|uniref:Cysteine synthase n=1 Tax=hydrothermal vent metagenome TaxID=652676 RepID=A0A1W1BR11_9ZZZZ
MIANSVEELIGNTPLIKLNRLSKLSGATILGKCEFMNPSSSIKDRIALNMVNEAIKAGKINTKTTIIEPTSGNTGIGLASICASKGIKLILTMPESMSIERRKLLIYLGAKVVLTPACDGMQGSIDEAMNIRNKIANSVILQQFKNPNNPDMHRQTTAKEILKATKGELDYFVAGVGTGGTIAGVSEALRRFSPNSKSIAVEPSNSAVLSGGEAGSHQIQGIGAGFIPDILSETVFDEIIMVREDNAFEMARDVARYEGLLVGISSGANLYASYEIAKREENRGKTIVTILCDSAERYLSTPLFKDV